MALRHSRSLILLAFCRRSVRGMGMVRTPLDGQVNTSGLCRYNQADMAAIPHVVDGCHHRDAHTGPPPSFRSLSSPAIVRAVLPADVAVAPEHDTIFAHVAGDRTVTHHLRLRLRVIRRARSPRRRRQVDGVGGEALTVAAAHSLFTRSRRASLRYDQIFPPSAILSDPRKVSITIAMSKTARPIRGVGCY